MKNFLNNKLIILIVLAVLSRIVLLGGSLLINNDLEKNWVHFDGEWYLDIVKNGYDKDFPKLNPENILCNQGTGACQRNFAFFPLYPLSIFLVHSVSGLSMAVSGILLSNIFFLLAVVFLYLFTKSIFNQKIAFIASILFIVFPLGYVFSGVMSESLFLLLLILTLHFANNRKYLLAGLMGGLLSATRMTGILVLIPLLFLYWQQNKKEISDKNINWRIIFSLALVPVGLIVFCIFLNYQIGDFFAFIHIQEYWEKPVMGLNPLLAIPYSIIDYSLEGSLNIHLYNLVWFFGTIVLFFVSLKKKIVPAFLGNILLWMIIPLTAGSMLALPRYISVQFPIFIIVSKLLKNRIILYSCVVLSFIGLLFLSFYYIKGFWITV